MRWEGGVRAGGGGCPPSRIRREIPAAGGVSRGTSPPPLPAAPRRSARPLPPARPPAAVPLQPAGPPRRAPRGSHLLRPPRRGGWRRSPAAPGLAGRFAFALGGLRSRPEPCAHRGGRPPCRPPAEACCWRHGARALPPALPGIARLSGQRGRSCGPGCALRARSVSLWISGLSDEALVTLLRFPVCPAPSVSLCLAGIPASKHDPASGMENEGAKNPKASFS